ncbi:MAG: ATP-binding cassette domain-containing protein [Bacteriovoracaceae bacterium]
MTARLQRKFGQWILHHAWEFKWHYLGAFASLALLQFLQVQIPERIRTLTELMAKGRLSEVSEWLFLGLAFGILIFRTLSRLLFFYPARVQQKLLRMELLEKLETVPTSRFTSYSQGQVFQILFDDVNNLRAFIGFGLLQVFNLFIAGFVLVPKLNSSDPYLWPAFIPLFSSVGLYTIITLINQKIFKKIADKKGEVQQYIIESYEAKQTIKNFHQEKNFITGFVKLSSQELSLFFKSSIGFAISGPYVKLGLGASLLWASILIKHHGGSTSDLVFFSGFLYLFLEPVMFMSWVAVVMSQGLAAWKRVKDLYTLLETPSFEESELVHVPITREERLISLPLQFWERPVKLELDTGKWNVLFGETGSGKTYLLSRLAVSLILKGEKVSMVQQEPYLFNDTVQENIFLGPVPNEEARARAKYFLSMFQLDSLEENLDKVMTLEVGENGKRLSGGQMKRIALIRSLMSGAPVLIWDDPFSSVDIILEKKIMEALKMSPECVGKTFVISSHRLTTVRLSNKAIYISRENGIESEGPVTEVLKENKVVHFFKEQLVGIPLA